MAVIVLEGKHGRYLAALGDGLQIVGRMGQVPTTMRGVISPQFSDHVHIGMHLR